jgi:hypothetical protein
MNCGVLFEVRTGCLNIIRMSFGRLNHIVLSSVEINNSACQSHSVALPSDTISYNLEKAKHVHTVSKNFVRVSYIHNNALNLV